MSPRKPTRFSKPRRVYQLRVALQYIEPSIWRTVLVPETLTLPRLDRVVQAAMGWTNSHLHGWRIDGRRYGMLDPEWEAPEDLLDERKFTVGAVLGEDIGEFVYLYDFGNGWEHRIVVEKRLEADPARNTWPMCIAGANACPPEDVGGPRGYMGFLRAIGDPAHEEHSALWRWHGGPFDPLGFSLNEANRAIRRLR